MTEILDEQIQKPSRPTAFLMVLLILTSANILYQLFGTVANLGSGESLENFQEELVTALENSGTDINDLPAVFREAIEEFIPDLVNNIEEHTYFSVAYYLLLILPVWLMYKRKKLGLYLYIALQIVGTFDFLYFYRTNIITLSATVLFALGTALFILLYWLNRKELV